MTMSTDLGVVSGSPAVRAAAVSAAPPMIVHPRRCGCDRASCREARRAPVTVHAEVVAVDSRPQMPRPRAEVGPRDTAAGWAQVGQWLACVAALSVFAVAFALLGALTAR